MLVRIKNYTMQDVTDGIKMLLDRASTCQELRTLTIGITESSEDKIAAIYRWIRSNVNYVPDPMGQDGEIELFISPVKMVKDYNAGLPLGGDCDDIAILATSMLRSIGIQSNVMLLDTIGEGFDHAVSRAWSDRLNCWAMVDASTKVVPLGWAESYQQIIII
jgi:transglutaminase-like putative cysteine protease